LPFLPAGKSLILTFFAAFFGVFVLVYYVLSQFWSQFFLLRGFGESHGTVSKASLYSFSFFARWQVFDFGFLLGVFLLWFHMVWRRLNGLSARLTSQNLTCQAATVK
jgi:hypothetical protein